MPLSDRLAMENAVPPPYASAHQLHDPNVFAAGPPTLVSQPDLGLGPFQFDPQLANQPDLGLSARTGYDTSAFDPGPPQQTRFQEIRSGTSSGAHPSGFIQDGQFGSPRRVSRQRQLELGDGQHMFGVLTPHPALPSHPQPHGEPLGNLRGELDLRPRPVNGGETTGIQPDDGKLVPNPPHLEAWRQKLFDVDGTIAMTEEQYV